MKLHSHLRGWIPALILGCSTAAVALADASGKPFNPDISVNFLGLANGGSLYPSNRGAVTHNGLELQETELQIFSDVDPYFRANALLSLAPTPAGDFSLDPEEVFLESTTLPFVTLRAGKFKAALGRHNQLHSHAFPFIDAPLINQELLGSEGLNDAGASAAVLMPTSWYMELTAQALGASNQNLFGTTNSGDVLAVAQLKNLWDLSDSATIDLDLFGANGNNQFGGNSSIAGADFTLKWRPVEGGKYTAIWWQTEYMQGNRGGAPGAATLIGDTQAPAVGTEGGIASWVMYQFGERWWVQIRGERTGLAASSDFVAETKQSALLGLFPSEFSGFRLQVDHYTTDAGTSAYNVAFQTNITIGAHPAHSY